MPAGVSGATEPRGGWATVITASAATAALVGQDVTYRCSRPSRPAGLRTDYWSLWLHLANGTHVFPTPLSSWRVSLISSGRRPRDLACRLCSEVGSGRVYFGSVSDTRDRSRAESAGGDLRRNYTRTRRVQLSSDTGRADQGDWRYRADDELRHPTLIIAVCLTCGGIGVMAAGIVQFVAPPLLLSLLSPLILWAGLLGATIFAFRRGRPQGLFSVRSTDVLWGLSLGLILRLAQGWISGADARPFPTLESVASAAVPGLSAVSVLLPAVLGPFVEELFFRAVLLFAFYRLLHRLVPANIAGFVAILLSTAGFVLLHALFQPSSLPDYASLSLVGVTLGVVVLSTGRIWGAVLAHVVYNVSFLVIAAIGSLLG